MSKITKLTNALSEQTPDKVDNFNELLTGAENGNTAFNKNLSMIADKAEILPDKFASRVLVQVDEVRLNLGKAEESLRELGRIIEESRES